MKVGDLVTATWIVNHGQNPLGIVTCIDPEEIGDNEEVEVLWTCGWTDRSNHSTFNLRVISGAH